MDVKTPILDVRKAEDIYKQALELAKVYCPEWAHENWEPDHFGSDDPGLVILKLFSRMAEYLITQLNRIPDKHRLAFLDFMGIDFLPPKSAKVPLTFYIAQGASGVLVSPGTLVAYQPLKVPEVVFETVKDLRVVATKMSAVCSHNTWEDKFTKHIDFESGERESGFFIFGKDIQEEPIDHVLYLGDDLLFDIRRQAEITIKIVGENLSSGYFERWYDGNDNSISSVVKTDGQLITGLSDIQVLPKKSVDEVESFWLTVKPKIGLNIVAGLVLPTITRIITDIIVQNILPEVAFFNDIPIDMKKGFYPFGEIPKTGDTLYIGSDEVFSKKGAVIILTLKVNELKLEDSNPVINWEYWDSQVKKWVNLKLDIVESPVLANSGNISFTCPTIEPVEINGKLNRWIRVKIILGNYGTPQSIEKEDKINEKLKLTPEQQKILRDEGFTFAFKYSESTLNPPFIQSTSIQYRYTNQPIQRIKTYNNFYFNKTDIGNGNKFQPYEPYNPLGEAPGFYLGFDKDMSIPGYPMTLYFALKETRYGEEPKEIINPKGQSNSKHDNETLNFSWEYFDGKSWKELSVDDETDSFTTGGIVSFLFPSDVQSKSEFEKDLYWIKVRPKEIGTNNLMCPQLKGIFPNTVWAVNRTTIRDEVLGSGNGNPNVSFFFSKKPVLEGQIIEVREDGLLSDDEVHTLKAEAGDDAVRLVRDEKTGEIKEVWVKWREVKDLVLSGTLDRHYIIDRANGKIQFGNGLNGMVPPMGKNNIVARNYTSGGGSTGNLASGKITVVKRKIPNIDRVVNHVSSSGGRDPENIDNVVIRGPHTIKNRNRAITKEDFEWLAYEASQDVAKVMCLRTDNVDKDSNTEKKISVIIVPKNAEDKPVPEAGLIDTVERYLKERAFLAIREEIEVIEPDYEPVNIEVTVKFSQDAESITVKENICNELKTFLHPLKGGQNGGGWDFGQGVYISEVAAVVEGIEGVDYTEHIKLKSKTAEGTEKTIEGVGYISLAENTLPCAGIIEVHL